MAETSQQVSGEKELPSINEELATIFPDCAEKFLKRKRGRPPKDLSRPPVPKIPSERGRGRPRIHPFKEKIPSERGRGRPRINPAKEKIPGRGRGRPKKASSSIISENQQNGKIKAGIPGTDEDVELERPGENKSAKVSRPGKVGRPRKTAPFSNDYSFDNVKRKIVDQLCSDPERLRKKARLSYVDDYVELDDEDEESNSDSDNPFPGESASETDSGFLSDTVPRKRGRPKKNKNLPVLKKSSLNRYQQIKVHLLQNRARRGRGRPPNKLKTVDLKRKRGRPKKTESDTEKVKVGVKKRGRPKKMSSNLNMKMREVSVSLERLNEDLVKKDTSPPVSSISTPVPSKKRGRPPKQVSHTGSPEKKMKETSTDKLEELPSGRKRGRPKGAGSPKVQKTPTGRGRGRPKKHICPEDQKIGFQGADSMPRLDKFKESESVNKSDSETDDANVLRLKSSSGSDLHFIVEVNKSESDTPSETDSDSRESDNKDSHATTVSGGFRKSENDSHKSDCEDSKVDNDAILENKQTLTNSNENVKQTGSSDYGKQTDSVKSESEKQTGLFENVALTDSGGDRKLKSSCNSERERTSDEKEEKNVASESNPQLDLTGNCAMTKEKKDIGPTLAQTDLCTKGGQEKCSDKPQTINSSELVVNGGAG